MTTELGCWHAKVTISYNTKERGQTTAVVTKHMSTTVQSDPHALMEYIVTSAGTNGDLKVVACQLQAKPMCR